MALPSTPTAYKPADCPVNAAYPAAPNGTNRITLSQDLPSYTVRQSDLTIDLNGHKIGNLVIADGSNRVRVSNGLLGKIGTALARSSTDPTRVNDLIVDHVKFVGGVSMSDGNGLRVGRFLMANCTSVAATSRTTSDGMHTCVLWLDPGSHDVVVQDCDFWTLGAEACMRFESAKRTIVHHTNLGCTSEKHCYRVH